MAASLFFPLLSGVALLFAILAFGRLLYRFAHLDAPADRSPAKGQVNQGVLYAFTLGMAPWAKESTRLHSLAYLRGVAFHLGIFLGLGLLIIAPWLGELVQGWRIALGTGAGLGALFGWIGFFARLVEHNLKAISTPDDYTSVLLVSLFLSAQALWLFGLLAAPVFYTVSALMLVYAPFGKIRHCFYFAFSRLFYGRFTGKRAVLPHSQQHNAR
jgi:hypothetical protein